MTGTSHPATLGDLLVVGLPDEQSSGLQITAMAKFAGAEVAGSGWLAVPENPEPFVSFLAGNAVPLVISAKALRSLGKGFLRQIAGQEGGTVTVRKIVVHAFDGTLEEA